VANGGRLSWNVSGLVVESDGVEKVAAQVRGLGPVVVGQHVNADGTPILECWSSCLSFAFHHERWSALSRGGRALAFYSSTDDDCFGFRYYEDGELVRRLDWKGGVALGSGEPLELEAALGDVRDQRSVFALIAGLGFAHRRPRRRRGPRFLRQVA
jgi:hypothetical protein